MTKDENIVIVPVIPQEPPRGVEQTTATVGTAQQVRESPKKKCAWCGREVNADAYVCPFCGKNPWGPWGRDGRSEQMYREYTEKETSSYEKASSGLTIGGILALLAGILALGQGILYVVVGETFASYAPSGLLCLCGGIDVLFGLLSIGAGIGALQRKHFALTLLGAICGMLGFGLLIGFVFGLIALILIAMTKEEFTS